MTRTQRKKLLEERLRWYEQMHHCYECLLSDSERAELHRWEKENLDGGIVGTSDWPGWRKYIGKGPRGLDMVSTSHVM